MKIRPVTLRCHIAPTKKRLLSAVYLNGLSAFLFHMVNKMLLNLSHQLFKGEHGSAVWAGTRTEPYRKRN